MVTSDEWSSPEVTGRTPLPCNRFTLAKVGENKAVMFGGWGGSTVDDLFILDLQKRHAVVSVPHTMYSAVCIGTIEYSFVSMDCIQM